jgi:hypothetical protein
MVFAKIRQNKGNYTESLFCANSDLEHLKDILDISVVFVLPFEIHGKSYAERKESLRDLAIDFQYNNDGDTDVQLSMGEWGAACDFFEENGRKYGLLREFRENCIC